MTIFHSEQLILNTSNISQERLDGEVVVISFNSGKYFSAKGPAADLFHLIENGIDQRLWVEILSELFPDFRAESAGISEFLNNGIEEQLFLALDVAREEKIELPSDYERGNWTFDNFSGSIGMTRRGK